ncbi:MULTISPECIES: SAV_915 family protein [Actinomyces]|nr:MULTISPECIES: SAV_915 family protein [Actinomyces]
MDSSTGPSFPMSATAVLAQRKQRQREAAAVTATEQYLPPSRGRHAADRPDRRPSRGGRAPRGKKPVIPPVLYLPSTGAPNTYGAEIELRKTNDGRMALLAYTALDRLADCMGPHQPWVLYPTERLGDLEVVEHYDVIYLDLPVPKELWRTAVNTDRRSAR